MDSLLERIEENKLDALYLFINETLRDRQTFDIFVQNLVTVLPHNWSIQRVELGHEFLSMVAADDQDDFFELICGLESLRTLIISDGYVPRKDNGSISAGALLSSLPKARNLINLDLQRLHIQTTAHVQMLESVFESLSESLEEIRITGLVMDDAAASKRATRSRRSKDSDDDDVSDFDEDSDSSDKEGQPFGMLDGPVDKCIEMSNLRSLTLSQKQQSSTSPFEEVKSLVSPQCLSDLCQNSTTLQDLCLRSMNLDDAACHTLAKALKNNSFLTSLDLRQNGGITDVGYGEILRALEQNFDLWCSVLVDSESFQAKFNSLIELNQANRGDLVRSPTREKLIKFISQLNESTTGSTSIWYFLTIHDAILYPLVHFLQFKDQKKQIPATDGATDVDVECTGVAMKRSREDLSSAAPLVEEETSIKRCRP